MAANSGGVSTRFYEEIEPFCRWKRGQESDTLEIHLPPGSKKEHLKIQINNLGVLTITGECPVDHTKWIRFRKETKVSTSCKRNEIRAKFTSGVLYVTMPKTKPMSSLEGLMKNNSETLNPKQDDICKSDEESEISKGVAEFYGRFIPLRQRYWKDAMVDGIRAAFVAMVAVVGAFKAYEYFQVSDSNVKTLL